MSINTIAPGVYTKIIDQGAYIDSTPSTIGFVPIICEKGPDNQFTRVTRSSFFETFGEPNYDYCKHPQFSMGPYVLSNFLSESNNAYTVRCLPDDALFAHLAIRTTGFDATGVSDGDTSSGYVMDFYPDYVVEASDMQVLNNYKSLQTLIHQGEVDTDAWSFDGDDSNDPVIMLFYGVGRGSYYNDIQVDMSPHPIESLRNDGLYILDVYKKQKFSKRFSSGATDTYIDYELIESFEVSFDPEAKDTLDGSSSFVVDVVNTYSNEIRCMANVDYVAEISRRAKLAVGNIDRVVADFSLAFSNDGEGRWRYIVIPDSGDSYDSTSASNLISGDLLTFGIPLAGGSEGSLFVLEEVGGLVVRKINEDTTSGGAPYILSRAYEGILTNTWMELDSEYEEEDDEFVSEVLDTEYFPLDVILDAGYPYTVKDSIVRLANTRRDAFAFIDNGDHKTPNRAIKSRKLDSTKTFSYNTEYVGIFEQYSQEYDPFSGKILWFPPTYFMAKVVGYSDKISEPWFALAGFNRAALNTIKNTRYNLNLGDREQFYLCQLNPIVKFPEGFAFFSQLTSKKRLSPLQDINIVRLILFIQRRIKSFAKGFLFEQNDDTTYSQLNGEISSFLREIQSRRGLYSFNVKVYATDLDKKNKRVQVDLFVKPTRVIEQIHVNFYVE